MITQEQIDGMSQVDFDDLEQMVRASSEQRQEAKINDTFRQFEELAAAAGLQMATIMSKYSPPAAKPKLKLRGRATPKYVHPDDANLTWAGRGLKPNWLTAYISDGGSIEDCKV